MRCSSPINALACDDRGTSRLSPFFVFGRWTCLSKTFFQIMNRISLRRIAVWKAPKPRAPGDPFGSVDLGRRFHPIRARSARPYQASIVSHAAFPVRRVRWPDDPVAGLLYSIGRRHSIFARLKTAPASKPMSRFTEAAPTPRKRLSRHSAILLRVQISNLAAEHPGERTQAPYAQPSWAASAGAIFPGISSNRSATVSRSDDGA